MPTCAPACSVAPVSSWRAPGTHGPAVRPGRAGAVDRGLRGGPAERGSVPTGHGRRAPRRPRGDPLRARRGRARRGGWHRPAERRRPRGDRAMSAPVGLAGRLAQTFIDSKLTQLYRRRRRPGCSPSWLLRARRSRRSSCPSLTSSWRCRGGDQGGRGAHQHPSGEEAPGNPGGRVRLLHQPARRGLGHRPLPRGRGRGTEHGQAPRQAPRQLRPSHRALPNPWSSPAPSTTFRSWP